jgi:hypothetical protein
MKGVGDGPGVAVSVGRGVLVAVGTGVFVGGGVFVIRITCKLQAKPEQLDAISNISHSFCNENSRSNRMVTSVTFLEVLDITL